MKLLRSSANGAFALIFALFCAAAALGQNSQVKDDLGRAFEKFDLNRVNSASAPKNLAAQRRLSITAAGKNYELKIIPNDIRSARYRTEDTGPSGMTSPGNAGIFTFKGTVEGALKSEVRLTIKGGDIEGFFQSGDERFFLEPAVKYSPAAENGEIVVYKAEDSLVQSPFFCESDIPTQISRGSTLVASGAVVSPAFRVIELATDADFEYVQTLGSAAQANSEILSILNMVEGAYNNELGLSIRVVFQHTWTTADPYTNTTSSAILDAFTNYWNANYPTSSVARDGAHLFSGKSAAVSRGVAWVSVICSNPQRAYGISGYVSWAPGKFLIPAHEIGHNLGANHAEATQNCANSLMNAALSGSTPLSFCSYSQTEISNYVAANGSCLSADAPPPAAGGTAFDFDGDGRADQSVFRGATGTWYLNRSTAGFSAFAFGLAGDNAVTADFDGDGRADPTIYRAGVWYILKSSNSTVAITNFGLADDLPVPADFTGDRMADVAVFRPSDGNWYWLSSASGAFSVVHFGLSGDAPIPADYDGDGKADLNVFRPSSGVWYRINSSNGSVTASQFGLSGDRASSGDFDGDAKADLTIFRPSNGTWYIAKSSGGYKFENFGLLGDIPTPADFDGDGRTDISVWRPSNGVWYRLDSRTGQFAANAFGLATDQPIVGYYVR